MWLGIALAGNALLAVVAIMDKFILSRAVKPVAFVFYSTVPALPLFAAIPFGVAMARSTMDWTIFIASGFFFALGLWAMYKGFLESEVSHVGPLVGAATPFFVVCLSALFLGERLTKPQLAGIGILILGSLLVSFEKSRRHTGWHRGMAWGTLAGLLYAISHVTAKYAYDTYGFFTGFVWTKAAIGLFGLLLLLFPAVRRILFSHAQKPTTRPQHNTALVVVDKFLGVAGVILIQYAIAIGSVSIVNALSGVQYGLLIIMVAALSKFVPRLFKEEYGRREVIQEAAAVIIIGIGLSLIVV